MIKKYDLSTDKILVILSFILLVYNINFSLNFIIHFIIIGLLFIVSFQQSIYIYAFISIWILEVYQGPYQVFIYIIDLLIIVKIIFFIVRENLKVKYLDILFLMVIFTYVIFSIILNSDVAAIRLLIGVCIALCVRAYIIKTSKDQIIYNILRFLLYSILFSTIYGLLHQNFDGTGRFYGIHAPNYMGLYINIGIIICLFTDIVQKYRKIFFLTFLFVGLLLTKSTSELALGLMILIAYLLINIVKYKDRIKKKTIFVVLTISMAIFIFSLSFDFNQIGAIERVLNRVGNTSTLDLNAITNNRAELWNLYYQSFLNFDVINLVFGSAIFTPMEYMQLSMGSHSTYIDLLWFVGFFGQIFIMINLFINLYFFRKSDYFKALVLIKFLLLVNMISMSLLSSRLFNVLFFL